MFHRGFPGGTVVKNLPANAGDARGVETIYLRLGLEPTCWDSDPAKTNGTWFQDLMKLRFLMSHHRKNSMRDKVIGKKWIYADSQRSTLHRQCGPLQQKVAG